MDDRNLDKTQTRKLPVESTTVDDKTRLAPSKNRPLNSQLDKTRIAPDKNTDKTVLKPDPEGHSISTDPANDSVVITQRDTVNVSNPVTDEKTRITNKSNQQNAEQDGNTRLDPRLNNPDDITRVNTENSFDVTKTQIAHSNQSTEPPDSLPLEPLNLEEVGEHGVLKKRFVLESVLGAGGMGIVYKAKDLLKVEAQDRDPYVAIKVLGEEFKSHPEAFISLQRESRKSQRIAHPNIVNVHDFDRDGDTVFMTMEFLDGSPLDKLIRRYVSTGLPTEDAWSIFRGMCAALSHAHAEKIIHSDFKPGNVFVTKKGVAKVFDFGIARAVAKVEIADDLAEDKTIFDAGNLGALTPAYASLEMLEGKEPDIRDDIYALGCVAYELFTAEHPYKKIPADEAARQGLKPKRITSINKKQWRAIEKAIAFKREDRIESVEKFVEAVSPKIRAANRWVTAFAFLLSIAITIYFLYFQQKPVESTFSEFDIRNELELKIRVNYLKENIDQLINKPVFTTRWIDATWKGLSDLTRLTNGEDPWLEQKKIQIYELYINKINAEISLSKYANAQKLILSAKQYTKDVTQLDLLSNTITTAIKQQKIRKAESDEAQRKRKVLLAKKQQQEKLAQQQSIKSNEQKQVQSTRDNKNFNTALENVNDQLKCINHLNMRNIDTAVTKLREIDNARYSGLESKIIQSLASCIEQMGKAFPERALEARKHSLRIFNSNAVLTSINIKARDACDISLAGLGARGKRAICRDKIKQAGINGPELVVIPGSSKIDAFAIGKYEISIAEFNSFCENSTACVSSSATDKELPVTDINIKVVKSYLKWISEETGKKYRLPTKNEWIYAAKSRRKQLDANRNCKLSTRGIEKGEGPVTISIGKQNSWGLVNYVGNVQEWVYDKGRKLIAVGGSYAQSMENCDITTNKPHSGSSDKITGFRVVREVKSST